MKKMIPLLLEDYAQGSVDNVRADLLSEWEAEPAQVNRFEILIAYRSVGSWGCDSSAWFLLREISTGAFFEAQGSHCSCYGFEGQFSPEPTTSEYLKSDKFSLSCGGYDTDEAGNRSAVSKWLQENL